MSPMLHRATGLVLAGALAACTSAAGERAQLARQELVGMPKAQLLSCAGVPDRSRVDAGIEYFTYENGEIYGHGGSTVGVYGGSGHFGTGVSVPLSTRLQSDYCEATFTLVNGRVAQLVYNSSRGGRFAECARIVESCLAYTTEPRRN